MHLGEDHNSLIYELGQGKYSLLGVRGENISDKFISPAHLLTRGRYRRHEPFPRFRPSTQLGC